MSADSEPILIYQIDAFTNEIFKGNPAAVCILHRKLKDEILRCIAAEMNLSETAFVHPLENRPLQETQVFSLRWFTPKVEVPLCGHATLATAVVLFQEIEIDSAKIEFKTASGVLTAMENEEGICINLPSDNPTRIDPPELLLEAIGVKNFIDVRYSTKRKSLLIHLPSQTDIYSLSPDYRLMSSLRLSPEIKGVIVTSKGSPPYDFVSRFFAPWVGINEDPVTGSAHTVLAPYWSELTNRNEMMAYQASERGGELSVTLKPNNTVDLIGNGVIVLKGKLLLKQTTV